MKREQKSKCCNAEIVEGLGYDGHKGKSQFFSEHNEHDDTGIFSRYWKYCKKCNKIQE